VRLRGEREWTALDGGEAPVPLGSVEALAIDFAAARDPFLTALGEEPRCLPTGGLPQPALPPPAPLTACLESFFAEECLELVDGWKCEAHLPA
jgi:hypothetical protein